MNKPALKNNNKDTGLLGNVSGAGSLFAKGLFFMPVFFIVFSNPMGEYI